MSVILKDKLLATGAWKGCDLVTSDSWIYQLGDDEVGVLDSALQPVKAQGLSSLSSAGNISWFRN